MKQTIRNVDEFDIIDIDDNEETSLLDFLTFDKHTSCQQEEETNIFSKKKKPIYLSFYTPTTMVNIQKRPYSTNDSSYYRYRWIYNVWIFVLNCFIVILKYIMTKSNELTIYVTKDPNYPTYNYSHVEISTDSFTYVAKWGSDFTRIQGRCLSPDTYGTVCINLSSEDYDIVVKECENAANDHLKFNYIGSIFNFILPSRIKNIVFTNGVYERQDACFCSEFVSRALIKTKAFSPLFQCEHLIPSLVSPIKLCILVSMFSQENITNVTTSYKLLGKKKKKTIIGTIMDDGGNSKQNNNKKKKKVVIKK